MRSFLVCAAAVAAATFVANNSEAAVLVQDDFEGYGAQANFTGFADLQVTDGAVDVLQDAGIVATPYGAGFVDLDGSSADGGYLRTDMFAFQAGDVVTFEFDYAGNRQGTFDSLMFGFKSSGLFTFKDVTVQNGSATNTTGQLIASSFGTSVNNLSPTAPWTHVSFSFTAGGAGSLSAYVGTSSADARGPLIDNFSLGVTPAGAAPEPAGWALMIGGFGGAGAMLRRRSAVA
jgi:hypothetical protein